MSSSKNVVPEAKEALNRFKMEAAQEVGVQKHQKTTKPIHNPQVKPRADTLGF